MHLVVFVPLVALLHGVIIARFARDVRYGAFSDDLWLQNVLLQLLMFNHNVGELHFILAQALFLDLVKQVNTCIVKTHSINNVEADARVQGRLLYFFNKGLLHLTLKYLRLVLIVFLELYQSANDFVFSIDRTLVIDSLHFLAQNCFVRLLF